MGTVACNLDKVSPIPALLAVHKEASLIRQILGGRRDLFDDLIEPHLRALWRAVQAKMGNDVDIDDVVQQAVFKAFTHLEQFRFEAGFRTWLIRIALNEVAQNWRKRFPSRSVVLDGLAVAETLVTDPKDSPFNVCARRQTSRLIRIALASLPEEYRVVVRMRDLEERSISEVAEMLCLTVAAVKTRHHRGRLRMAKFLSRTRRHPPRIEKRNTHERK
jgi:RNA polymerase sigma-70 factor, ECF subfamily